MRVAAPELPRRTLRHRPVARKPDALRGAWGVPHGPTRGAAAPVPAAVAAARAATAASTAIPQRRRPPAVPTPAAAAAGGRRRPRRPARGDGAPTPPAPRRAAAAAAGRGARLLGHRGGRRPPPRATERCRRRRGGPPRSGTRRPTAGLGPQTGADAHGGKASARTRVPAGWGPPPAPLRGNGFRWLAVGPPPPRFVVVRAARGPPRARRRGRVPPPRRRGHAKVAPAREGAAAVAPRRRRRRRPRPHEPARGAVWERRRGALEPGPPCRCGRHRRTPWRAGAAAASGGALRGTGARARSSRGSVTPTPWALASMPQRAASRQAGVSLTDTRPATLDSAGVVNRVACPPISFPRGTTAWRAAPKPALSTGHNRKSTKRRRAVSADKHVLFMLCTSRFQLITIRRTSSR